MKYSDVAKERFKTGRYTLLILSVAMIICFFLCLKTAYAAQYPKDYLPGELRRLADITFEDAQYTDNRILTSDNNYDYKGFNGEVLYSPLIYPESDADAKATIRTDAATGNKYINVVNGKVSNGNGITLYGGGTISSVMNSSKSVILSMCVKKSVGSTLRLQGEYCFTNYWERVGGRYDSAETKELAGTLLTINPDGTIITIGNAAVTTVNADEDDWIDIDIKLSYIVASGEDDFNKYCVEFVAVNGVKYNVNSYIDDKVVAGKEGTLGRWLPSTYTNLARIGKISLYTFSDSSYCLDDVKIYQPKNEFTSYPSNGSEALETDRVYADFADCPENDILSSIVLQEKDGDTLNTYDLNFFSVQDKRVSYNGKLKGNCQYKWFIDGKEISFKTVRSLLSVDFENYIANQQLTSEDNYDLSHYNGEKFNSLLEYPKTDEQTTVYVRSDGNKYIEISNSASSGNSGVTVFGGNKLKSITNDVKSIVFSAKIKKSAASTVYIKGQYCFTHYWERVGGRYDNSDSTLLAGTLLTINPDGEILTIANTSVGTYGASDVWLDIEFRFSYVETHDTNESNYYRVDYVSINGIRYDIDACVDDKYIAGSEGSAKYMPSDCVGIAKLGKIYLTTSSNSVTALDDICIYESVNDIVLYPTKGDTVYGSDSVYALFNTAPSESEVLSAVLHEISEKGTVTFDSSYFSLSGTKLVYNGILNSDCEYRFCVGREETYFKVFDGYVAKPDDKIAMYNFENACDSDYKYTVPTETDGECIVSVIGRDGAKDNNAMFLMPADAVPTMYFYERNTGSLITNQTPSVFFSYMFYYNKNIHGTIGLNAYDGNNYSICDIDFDNMSVKIGNSIFSLPSGFESGWHTVNIDYSPSKSCVNSVTINSEKIASKINVSSPNRFDTFCLAYVGGRVGFGIPIDDIIMYVPNMNISISEINVSLNKSGVTAQVISSSKEYINVLITNNDDKKYDLNLYNVGYVDNKLQNVEAKNITLDKMATTVISLKNLSSGRIFLWNKDLTPMTLADNYNEYRTAYYRQSDELIKNPNKGFINYRFGQQQDTEISKITSIINFRANWSTFEPADGEYDWTSLDDAIELAKQYNMKLGVGIQPASNNKGSIKSGTNVLSQASPLWLFENPVNCKYTITYFDDAQTGERFEAKVPVWDDPVYLEKMGEFINAFLDRYNDNPNIAYVDMRTYGNWGEWHVSGLDGPEEGTDDDSKEIDFEAMKKHIDLWKNSRFNLVMLGANRNALKYAHETLNCGARLDGFVNLYEPNTHDRIMMLKDEAITVGEWLEPGYVSYLPGGEWANYEEYLPILFERNMMETPLSVMSLANSYPDAFYAKYKNLCNYWVNKMGYWFKITEATYPTSLTSGRLKFSVKNDGTCPIYLGKDDSSCFKLAAFDLNNNILDTVVIEGYNFTELYSNQFLNVDTQYAFKNIADGKSVSKIALGLFTDRNLDLPDIRLGSLYSEENLDNWFVLNTASDMFEDNILNSAVINASNPYAQLGYGYHHADFAIDGDLSTYWESSYKNNPYFEADFGNGKEFDSISIYVPSAINFDYVISLFDGTRWTKLLERDILNTGINVFNFEHKLFAKKIKLSFNCYQESSDGNLLKNPGFEEDMYCVPGWSVYCGYCDCVNQSQETYDGMYAVAIKNRLSSYSGIKQNIIDIISENGSGTYDFSAMLKGSTESAKYAMRVSLTYVDGTKKGNSTATICNASEWKNVRLSLQIDDVENLESAILYFESNDGNKDEYYIDSVQMIKEGN